MSRNDTAEYIKVGDDTEEFKYHTADRDEKAEFEEAILRSLSENQDTVGDRVQDQFSLLAQYDTGKGINTQVLASGTLGGINAIEYANDENERIKTATEKYAQSHALIKDNVTHKKVIQCQDKEGTFDSKIYEETRSQIKSCCKKQYASDDSASAEVGDGIRQYNQRYVCIMQIFFYFVENFITRILFLYNPI